MEKRAFACYNVRFKKCVAVGESVASRVLYFKFKKYAVFVLRYIQRRGILSTLSCWRSSAGRAADL